MGEEVLQIMADIRNQYGMKSVTDPFFFLNNPPPPKFTPFPHPAPLRIGEKGGKGGVRGRPKGVRGNGKGGREAMRQRDHPSIAHPPCLCCHTSHPPFML